MPSTLLSHFADLPDPRVNRTKHHSLGNILTIAICAVIGGAEDWVSIEEFGNAKLDFFQQLLDLPHGIPSHDTFGRVFAALDTEAFAEGFSRWVATLAQSLGPDIVAIDGKTMRRSLDKANRKAAVHLVSAFAQANHLVLGQTKVETKSNEITAIPALLKQLALSGCLVTLDAMGCQKTIAEAIVDADADYLLSLKANHGNAFDEVREAFDYHEQTGRFGSAHETLDGEHGRIERRIVQTMSAEWFEESTQWKGLRSFVRVQSERHIGEQVSRQTRYFLSSLPAEEVQRAAEAVRGHWCIENQLHWCLDVAFNEDQQRMRSGNAAPNMALLSKIALNLLKHEKSTKIGVKNKRLRAGWDERYLLKVLAAPLG